MKKIPFKDIDDQDEFWCGSTFRKEGTNLNNADPNEDFYEYVLFLDKGNSDCMICAHTDKWEIGIVVSYVTMTKETNRATVTAKEFKRSMILPEEIDLWYFIDQGIRETRIKNTKHNKSS
jgi:hypothetical protein